LAISPNYNYRLKTDSVLRDAGNAALYPFAPTLPPDDDILDQLFWIIGGDGGLTQYLSFPIFLPNNPPGSKLEYRGIGHYLSRDLDFNIGDLRPGYVEGPRNPRKKGAEIDIGAYEY
jgi:hypothetical protein